MFADMQRGHYVHSASQTVVKAKVSKHAMNHLDPNLLSRGETDFLLIPSNNNNGNLIFFFKCVFKFLLKWRHSGTG